MSNPGRTLGRYELIARIGEGGMAEVYLARQRGPKAFEKLVVVKTVHPRLASKPALAESLLEEARIAAKVRHPHVVDIYDLGEQDGTYFIAMEYLEGESMTSIIRAQRAKGGVRLSPLRTAQVIADCAAGLHAAHELRTLSGEPLELVHQDVTPGNVFVLYTGQAKLLDFGVAKVRSTSDADLVKGKAGYLAPELFEKHRADRRSDVFALGVVLWESLTLRRLFGGATDADAFAKIRQCDVPPPSTLAPGLPPELDAVCARALTKSRDERYATARAMRDDLVALLSGAERNDYEAMATYMRAAFVSQIAARTQLLRELDAGGLPEANTLDAITATFDDRSPIEASADGDAPAPTPARATTEPPAVEAMAKTAGKRLAPLPPPKGRSPALTARASTAPGAGAATPGPRAPTVDPATPPAIADAASAPTVIVIEEASSGAVVAPTTTTTVEPAEPRSAAAVDDVDDGELIDDPSGLVEVPDPPSRAPVDAERSPAAAPEAAVAAPEAPTAVAAATATDDPAAEAMRRIAARLRDDPSAPVAVASADDEPRARPTPEATRRRWLGLGLAALALVVLIAVIVGRGERPAGRGAAAARELDAGAGGETLPGAGVLTADAGSGSTPPDAAGPIDAPGPIDAAAAVDAAIVAIAPGHADPGSLEPPKRDPAKAAALTQDGLKQFMGGDAGAAIAKFQAALKADKSYAPAQRGLGLAYEKRGDKPRAARAFRAYLALAPNARDGALIRAKLAKL